MSRYMPITGIDCNIPALLIDTQAPLSVLHETAHFRIQVVTSLLEALTAHEKFSDAAAVLQEEARLLVVLLRDGCDLLDVIGRRLKAQPGS